MCSENKSILGVLTVSSLERVAPGGERGKQEQMQRASLRGPVLWLPEHSELWGVAEPCLQHEWADWLSAGSSSTGLAPASVSIFCF